MGLKKSIKINGKIIGDRYKSFIIAEIGQAHGGSFKKALKYIDLISKTGADAIKFQTHIADAESTLDEPFRVSFSKKFKSRYQYWKAMEFSFSEWKKISNYSKKKGLIFLSSPFSVEGVNLLNRLGVKALKIGSGEFFSKNVISAMIKTKKPLILSTGMSKMSEINKMAKIFEKKSVKYAILQCTSLYPSSLKTIGLNILHDLKKKYNCPIGLSDHSGSIYSGLAALAYGANILEVHVTTNYKSINPDMSSSINLQELETLCKARDAFYEIQTHPIDKDKISSKLHKMKKIFGKSIALKKNLQVDSILTLNNLTTKKPGFGIPEDKIKKLIGKKLKKSVSKNRLLKWTDIYA